MERDIFQFCDEDLMSSAFSSFQNMRAAAKFVDFTVTFGNGDFLVHRIILVAAIPYISEICPDSCNRVWLQQIDPEVSEDIINFAYCGKVNIHERNVFRLLHASQFLQLTKVHTACLKFAASRINATNFFDLRNLAPKIQSFRLSATCDFWVLRNFEAFTFAPNNEFSQFPFPYLNKLITRDDLNVSSEERVFEAVVKWVKAQPEGRSCYLPELLTSVRLALLTPLYLLNTVSSEELIRSSTQCKALVEEAKDFHLSGKVALPAGIVNTRSRNAKGQGLYAICSSVLGRFIEMFYAENDTSGTWIPLSQIVNMNFGHVVGHNGKLYIFKYHPSEVETFDVNTLKRDTLETSESSYGKWESRFQKIILHDNEFYAFSRDKIFAISPVLKKWRVETVMQCNESGVASLGDYIYVTGGFIGGNLTADCKRYDPRIGITSKIAPMFSGRSCHCCCGLNNKLYVCHFDKGEIYNPVTDQWNSIASMTFSRPVISLAAYRGKLYALKGEKTEIYDPKNNVWTLDAPLPSPCRFINYVTIPFSQ